MREEEEGEWQIPTIYVDPRFDKLLEIPGARGAKSLNDKPRSNWSAQTAVETRGISIGIASSKLRVMRVKVNKRDTSSCGVIELADWWCTPVSRDILKEEFRSWKLFRKIYSSING